MKVKENARFAAVLASTDRSMLLDWAIQNRALCALTRLAATPSGDL